MKKEENEVKEWQIPSNKESKEGFCRICGKKLMSLGSPISGPFHHCSEKCRREADRIDTEEKIQKAMRLKAQGLKPTDLLILGIPKGIIAKLWE